MKIKVSNAFRLLGSGELKSIVARKRFYLFESQMPFGFWVLGNPGFAKCGEVAEIYVSNAFRLLGSGELVKGIYGSEGLKISLKCLSAFGFWGTMT